MAYAGATVRVISRVKDYGGHPITGSQGVTVTLDIFDKDRVHFAGPLAMAWETVEKYWFFDWDTAAAGAEPETYRTKVLAQGSLKRAWSVGRLTLKQSPV